MTKTESYITASRFYLCEQFPENFDELDEKDVTDFIRDNRWELFDPIQFYAEDWVSLAKAEGMRYIVITSKHHNGFCLFDADEDWEPRPMWELIEDLASEFVTIAN